MEEKNTIRARLTEKRANCRASLQKKEARFLQKLHDDGGIGTIEMVLILVVLIALVIIFRDRIKTILGSIMDQINSSATSVWS